MYLNNPQLGDTRCYYLTFVQFLKIYNELGRDDKITTAFLLFIWYRSSLRQFVGRAGLMQ